eukprot:865089-Pyramimonas_sp.AAC.1
MKRRLNLAALFDARDQVETETTPSSSRPQVTETTPSSRPQVVTETTPSRPQVDADLLSHGPALQDSMWSVTPVKMPNTTHRTASCGVWLSSKKTRSSSRGELTNDGATSDGRGIIVWESAVEMFKSSSIWNNTTD